jgi:hypothetical protein
VIVIASHLRGSIEGRIRPSMAAATVDGGAMLCLGAVATVPEIAPRDAVDVEAVERAGSALPGPCARRSRGRAARPPARRAGAKRPAAKGGRGRGHGAPGSARFHHIGMQRATAGCGARAWRLDMTSRQED